MLANPENDLEFKLARARGRVTLPGKSFETSRKIPEEVFSTGQERVVADLLDSNLVSELNSTVVIKCFLHISKEEQKERLLARLDDPAKHWKFNPGDLKERALWDAYQQAYEAAISRCNTADAPWYVIPADKKWYRNYAVTRVLVETLERLDLRPPTAGFDPEEMHAELA